MTWHCVARHGRPSAAACEISWLAAPLGAVSFERPWSAWKKLAVLSPLLLAGRVVQYSLGRSSRLYCAVLCSTRSAGRETAAFVSLNLWRSLALTRPMVWKDTARNFSNVPATLSAKGQASDGQAAAVSASMQWTRKVGRRPAYEANVTKVSRSISWRQLLHSDLNR